MSGEGYRWWERAAWVLVNILWLVLSGVWVAILYVAMGLICCVSVVLFPWGVACLRMAGYVLWPFGSRGPVRRAEPPALHRPRNLLWLAVGGVWLVALHTVAGVGFVVTYLGMSFGARHLQMVLVMADPTSWTVERIERIERIDRSSLEVRGSGLDTPQRR